MDKKLSDLPIKNTPDGTEFIHILDVNDLSDSPEGTDKRTPIQLSSNKQNAHQPVATLPITGVINTTYILPDGSQWYWDGVVFVEISNSQSLTVHQLNESYKLNDFVSKKINDTNYIFQSNSDNNTTEPTLTKSIKPWVNFLYGGVFKGTWNSTTAYVNTDVLLRDGYLYFCLTNNTNSDPILLTPPNWLKIGIYKGVHFISYINGYEIGDVVIDGLNNVFISNVRFNNFSLTTSLNHAWDIVSDKKTTIVCWGDSLTAGFGSYGNNDYPNLLANLTGLNMWNGGVPSETSTQIKSRFLADKTKWSLPTIFWVGRNNNSNTTTVKADIAEMVAKLGHNNFLVLGIIKSTGDGSQPINGLNSDLQNTYGERFIDVQSYLLQYFDATIPQDVSDNSAGRIAWSLRSDWLHLNNKSYKLVAEIIASKINFLKNNSNSTNSTLLSSGIRVEGNEVPLERKKAVEIGYRKDLDFGFIGAYDRINNIVKDFSIQYSAGSILRLIEQGGKVLIGKNTTQNTQLLNIFGKTIIEDSGNVFTIKQKNTGNPIYIDFITNANAIRGSIGYLSNNGNNMFVYNEVGDLYLIANRIFLNNLTILNSTIRLKNYTVSTLPTGVQGDCAFVTDALSPTFMSIVSGGGTVVTKVFFNGTNWIVQ